MATNDFQVFAGAVNANVIPQSSYLSLPATQLGFQTGIAQSAQLNKVWRQPSIIGAMIAQFIVDQTGLNAVDDGTIATLEANFIKALQIATNTVPITNIGLTLNVATNGSDSNNGLSLSTPFATMQHAALIAATNYNSQGNAITVNVAPGTYSAGANITGPLPGNGPLSFVGTAGATATNITLLSPGTVFNATTGARITVSGFSMSAPVGSSSFQGNCLGCLTGAQIVFDHCIFGAAQTAHVQCQGGQVYTTGAVNDAGQPYTISGGAQYHWLAVGGGSSITPIGSTITMTGTPNFSVQFANSQAAGFIFCPSCTFVGSATGQKYAAATGGTIDTLGAGINFLPGNVAGTSASGYYI